MGLRAAKPFVKAKKKDVRCAFLSKKRADVLLSNRKGEKILDDLRRMLLAEEAICQTLGIGFGASVLDLGTVLLAIIMNNQIMRYGNTTALAIYGVVTTISALFQSLYSGVGQAIQPVVSANCGAKHTDRIHHASEVSR